MGNIVSELYKKLSAHGVVRRLYNGLAMKSSGIETPNNRMRTTLNRIINLAPSTDPAIFYSRCCGFVLFDPKLCQ